MMRSVLSMMLLWLSAGSAIAQTVPVRAGEHETFTRLVFDLPERMEYELRESSGQATLKLARKGLRFDTSRVFQRVPKSRLIAISSSETLGEVTFSLSCECEIKTSWFGAASLVVDIFNPAADSVDRTRSPAEKDAVKRDDAPAVSFAAIPADLRPRVAAQQFSRDFPKSSLAKQFSSPAVDAIRSGRERLLRQLARAASQGLLSPRTSLPEPTSRTSAPDPSHDATVEAHRAGETWGKDVTIPRPSTVVPNIQLHAETGIDRDMREVLRTQSGSAAAEDCPDSRSVAVPEWGSDAPFWAQLGITRSRLVGEFDKPDPEAIRNLARLYIYFGFGAEARNTLEQFNLSKPDTIESFETAVLFDLADILDQGHSNRGHLAPEFLNCGPILALWTSLSRKTLPANLPMDAAAILRGFSALPSHLRTLVGPSLARRFRDAGYLEESDQVRRILNRSNETQTLETELLEAEAALQAGNTHFAETQLEAVVKKGNEASAKALVQLIDARLARKAGISYDLALLAGAYATEHRGEPFGAELSRAHVLGLAASGAFDEAFEEFSSLEVDDPGRINGIFSELMEIVTRSGSDVDFLRRTLTLAREMPDALQPEVANAVGSRLLSLGFPEVAAEILASDAKGASARERKLLHAEIALEQNRPRQAEVELTGITGEDADLLRARARSMVGDHTAAEQLFRDLGKQEEAWREAWLGGDWETLLKHHDNAVVAIAKRRLGSDPEKLILEEGHAILAHNRELVADSRNLRDHIISLLESHAKRTPFPEI